jgi:hypothetical protein
MSDEPKKRNLLEIQQAKLIELEEQFNTLLMGNPRNGHGGTPDIIDNAKGRQMMRVQEKHEERLRSLNEKIKEQKLKIERTENREYRRNTITKAASKRLEENGTHPGLAILEEQGKVTQWKRNPDLYFIKGLDKVALFYCKGKLGINKKYCTKTPEEWDYAQELINSVTD